MGEEDQRMKKTDFYGGKPETLPRFVYRRLAGALGQPGVDRAQAIASAIAELATSEHPDVRKFKFYVPQFLRALLSLEEIKNIEGAISAKRRVSDRLKLVYPHVSDEYALDAEFMASIFDLSNLLTLKKSSRFFTLGSCFARNIASHLLNNGYNASAFTLTEDLNSPISNAFMFDIATRPLTQQREILGAWICRIFPEIGASETERLANSQIGLIDQLAGEIRRADCIVLTLGNVVDFFKVEDDPTRPLLDKIFPKFIAMSPSEDIEIRSKTAARLKGKGGTMRLASYQETKEAITSCLSGIRALTPAPVVATLSPVPIDSVIGLANTKLRSAIEVDCVSKSRLRSAFDDIAQSPGAPADIYYFPSFEIVRWVAPMLPYATFGLDDAAARHVSSPILDAVCSLFLSRAIQWTEA